LQGSRPLAISLCPHPSLGFRDRRVAAFLAQPEAILQGANSPLPASLVVMRLSGVRRRDRGAAAFAAAPSPSLQRPDGLGVAIRSHRPLPLTIPDTRPGLSPRSCAIRFWL